MALETAYTLFWLTGEEAGSGSVVTSHGELGDRVAFEQRRGKNGVTFRLHLTQQVAGIIDSEIRRTALPSSLTISRQQVAATTTQHSRCYGR